MKILKWAAVAVTALFVLMNLGAVLGGGTPVAYRIAGVVLGLAGAAAALGLATDRSWGRAAIIVVGGLNVLGSVVALIDHQQGAVVGLVVGGLAVVLGVLAVPGRRPVPAG